MVIGLLLGVARASDKYDFEGEHEKWTTNEDQDRGFKLVKASEARFEPGRPSKDTTLNTSEGK